MESSCISKKFKVTKIETINLSWDDIEDYVDNLYISLVNDTEEGISFLSKGDKITLMDEVLENMTLMLDKYFEED